ncbi:hypothetical protein [Microtetraspora malaysiensis]|uniref:Uncharacterized protein n=1 Tax=Microtetraspora malaysiensis TaxID=161358 RepID=A0ABW6T138_9ACTN
MELLAQFHGIHVAPLQKAHEKLAWMVPAQRANKVRVHLHTCECRATIYELCQAGGLRFVRRSVRGEKGVVVRETEWLRAVKAEQLWQRILLGEAR